MTSTDDDTALDILTRRLDEIRLAAETVATYGECLRLIVLLEEAKADFIRRVGPAAAKRQIMWSVRFERARSHVDRRYRGFYDTYEFPEMVEATAPTIETFFHIDNQPSTPPDPEQRQLNADQIDEAELRLGIRIEGFVRKLFSYRNGGHSNFCFHPNSPWSRLDHSGTAAHPETPYQGSSFSDEWTKIFDHFVVHPTQKWFSVEQFMLDDIAYFEDEGVEYELDPNWRDLLPGMDKLIVISDTDHWRSGVYILTCLDYRFGNRPGIVMVEADRDCEYFNITESWPCFETFFHRLRRWPLREIDGAVRKRGYLMVDVFENGRWRPKRY